MTHLVLKVWIGPNATEKLNHIHMPIPSCHVERGLSGLQSQENMAE